LNDIVHRRLRHALVSLLASLVAGASSAEEQAGREGPRFGGPDAVEGRIEEDARDVRALISVGVLEPYFDFKQRVAEATGLHFAVDYTVLGMAAEDSVGKNDAASGMLRIYGSWDLFGNDTSHPGALVYKLEHRHRYGDIPASGLASNLGYVGLFEPPFSNQLWRLTNLYWRQRLFDGRVMALAGWVDSTDYVDAFALASPWLHFMNFAFSTGTTTIPVPNEGLGAAAGGLLTDNLYMIAGLTDLNADPHDPSDGFETFFEDHEYFSHLEFGWTTSQQRIVLDNVHLTLWHADERDDAGVNDGWGAVVSLSRYVGDYWMPFLRAGYAKDGGSLTEASVSIGVGYETVPGRDLLGVAANWGDPNADTFGSGLDDQYALEIFYRFALTPHLTITPDVQLLIDPAMNPEDDVLWVFGLRARLDL
jgi:porin